MRLDGETELLVTWMNWVSLQNNMKMHMALSQVCRKRLVPVYHVNQLGSMMERSRMFLRQVEKMNGLSRSVSSAGSRDIWLAIVFRDNRQVI